jgi:hypothetical protein
MTHLEATAIQVTLAGRTVKILATYLSPSRPLIGVDLTTCFGGGLPVLMAGDLNAKHMDWNSWLTTRRGKLVRDFADKNSCLIFKPDTPTTNPPDILDIVITWNISSPVYLTTCSTLILDHLLVLIDTKCHSSFLNPPDRADFRRNDWVNFQTPLEDQIPFDPEMHNEWQSTCALRTSPAPY